MAFQPCPKTAEVVVKGTLAGELCINKFYVSCDGGMTPTIVTDVAVFTDDWVAATWLDFVGGKFTYVSTTVRDLSVEASYETIATTNTGAVGAGGSDTGPNNRTFAVHRQTAFSGKKQKSRIYVPSIPNAATTDANHISSASAGEFVTALGAWDTLVEDYAGATLLHGYVIRVRDGLPLDPAQFQETIGWSVTDLILDSARRRLPGRGA